MAEPKKKSTRSGRKFRREKLKIKSPAISLCPKCKSPKPAHQVCPVCGTYKGHEFIEPKASKKKTKVRKR